MRPKKTQRHHFKGWSLSGVRWKNVEEKMNSEQNGLAINGALKKKLAETKARIYHTVVGDNHPVWGDTVRLIEAMGAGPVEL